MSDLRARPDKLRKPEDGLIKIWSYSCFDHSMTACFENGFFNILQGNFMAGDTICLLQFEKDNDDPRDNRLECACEVKVVDVRNGEVEIQPYTDRVVNFTDKKEAHEPEKEVSDPPPEYIQDEDAKVKWTVGSRKWQVKVGDNVVALVDDKDLAYSIARGDEPLPAIITEPAIAQ